MTSIVSTEHLDALKSIQKLIAEGNLSEAVESLDAILKDDPAVPEALFLLGICSLKYNRVGNGIKLITQAHDLDPDCRDYVDALASLNAKTGHLNESLYYAKLSTAVSPHPELPDLLPPDMANYAQSLLDVSNSRYLLGVKSSIENRNFTQGVTYCREELLIDPNSAEAHYLLGICLNALGDHENALDAFHAAQRLKCRESDIRQHMANSLLFLGRGDEALACIQDAMDQDANDINSAAQYVETLSYLNDAQWALRGDADDEAMRRAQNMGVEFYAQGDVEDKSKIRIGFLCDTFYSCDEVLPFATFLNNRDRSRVEVHVYLHSTVKDGTTRQLTAACDSVRTIYDLDDFVIANIIAGDGIHVLFDLVGYGTNQTLGALCSKPAKLQVAWLNHLDGTRDGNVELILSDEQTHATDTASALDGQSTATLPTGLYAYSPFTWMGEPQPLPAKDHGNISFGAYVNIATLSPDIARAWCRVLERVPNAYLILNAGDHTTPNMRRQISQRFAHFNMDHRVVFLEPRDEDDTARTVEDYFLSGIDILLDAPTRTNPAQSVRAMWMGIPVLTIRADRRIDLATASVLHCAGKSEWIADDPEALADTAAALCADIGTLENLRKTLRDDIKESDLFNEKGFAAAITGALEHALKDRGIL